MVADRMSPKARVSLEVVGGLDMGKRSKWQSFLTVSASGPEFSPLLEKWGYFGRTRMAADLRYTTADVDFLESHFKEPN
jgi:hypothetical protein